MLSPPGNSPSTAPTGLFFFLERTSGFLLAVCHLSWRPSFFFATKWIPRHLRPLLDLFSGRKPESPFWSLPSLQRKKVFFHHWRIWRTPLPRGIGYGFSPEISFPRFPLKKSVPSRRTSPGLLPSRFQRAFLFSSVLLDPLSSQFSRSIHLSLRPFPYGFFTSSP